ncbi:sugar phosphate isomerase/epimerase [Spirosoma sp. KCTC 42546]|uniref:sugar phosphate isomerase/epimerase family protein n=1 Tax=Spirosoma sp. KCTC 42546 TaxID=2520506 RepID=UPI0011578AFA|nr:sugar phosphate isomerase/epimerase family protein [Spirosoma sp. KCTC 42546]QDK83515.1 sugar phosphate isomerase/epimerase [Spirosoma sp. KCTC 42546]
MNRRNALRYSLGVGLSTLVYPAFARSLTAKSRFHIGACDWSIGPAGDINSFKVAKQIGLDGVQLSLNTKADHELLRRAETQRAFKEAAKQAGVAIGGLAIGLLNEIPYKSDARTEQWVQDSVDVAHALGVKNVLLAFFSNNDLRNDPKGTQVVIDRLKAVAPKAEKAGVVLGIESWLSASEHIAILDAVGSSAVQVYYDVCNSSVMGYPIFDEIRTLGKSRICEIHLKENDHLLGQGIVDLQKVRQVLDEIGYTGWLQIEGAIPKGKPMLESYIENNKTVRSLFG